ncbi:MAG: hypothetical protein IKP99_05010 [Bacteroidales bacterium]|nr:hypothetical protein [Bacteroidales bacterium]MBR6265376.1 hypothetical protein [Bacteroidales bacterium]
MSQIINNGKELLRIGSKGIEVSTNGGRTWLLRHSTTSFIGTFQDLASNGDEILATTSKGLFVSRNGGRMWIKRHS